MLTVARFHHLDDAYSAVAVLWAHGIEVFLPDECTIGLYWPYCHALGDIRLQVHDGDLERSREILAGAVVHSLRPGCPRCGSTELRLMRFGVWSALAIFVGFCPPPQAARYHCPRCRTTFRAAAARRDPNEEARLGELALAERFVDATTDDWPRYLRFPFGACAGAAVWAALLPVQLAMSSEPSPLATSLVVAGLLGGACALLLGLADDMRRKHFASERPSRSNGGHDLPE